MKISDNDPGDLWRSVIYGVI